MERKSTDELRHEIKSATDIEDFLKNNRQNMALDTLSGHLHALLSRKGLSRADVVRNSLLNRTYVYQIFSGDKTPSRDKLIAIAFGLHLSEEETQLLLRLSKNPELYARDGRDAVILFALQRNKSILEVNDILFKQGYKPLGVPEE